MDSFTIRLYGDPVLRDKAQPVPKIDAKLHRLLRSMAQTMYDADGVGLAAPQVGVLKRVVVIDIGEGLLELINPEIIASADDKELGVEGCLSLPGIVGDVCRNSQVMVRAFNGQGQELEIEGEGLLARALQHELDHLDGVLFIDKAQNLRSSPSPED